MSPDRGDNVSHAEFDRFREYLDERFRALQWRGLLALGLAVGVIKFDDPNPVTIGAVGLAVGSALVKAIVVIIGGKSL